MVRSLTVVATLLVALMGAESSLGGTSFTYQGKLDQNGGVVNAQLPMSFALYDAANGGTLLGTLNFDGGGGGPLVDVTDSVFQVELDFGSGPYNANQPLWLEITVDGTLLSPRQSLTAAPFALNTRGVFVDEATNFVGVGRSLQLAPSEYFGIGTPASGGNYGGMFVTANGGRPYYGYSALTGEVAWHYLEPTTSDWRLYVGQQDRLTVASATGHVGIGTTSPTAALDVIGSVKATSFVGDGSGLTNLPVNAQWTDLGPGLAYTAGNVGIGTLTPTAPLEVAGSVKATSFVGDGSGLTNLPVNAQWTDLGPGLAYTAGNVGIGTLTPTAPLEVAGSVKATAFVGDGSGLTGLPPTSLWTDAAPAVTYTGGNVGIGSATPSALLEVGPGSLDFGNVTTLGVEMRAQDTVGVSVRSNDGAVDPLLQWCNQPNGVCNYIGMNAAGDLYLNNNNFIVNGEIMTTAINLTSDRDAKEGFGPVDPRSVLERVVDLPISEWRYKNQDDIRHIGPVAQDFWAAFGLGRGDKHIASVDADGVALAAIQGLNAKLQEASRQKDGEIDRLRRENQALSARLEAIERALGLQNGTN